MKKLEFFLSAVVASIGLAIWLVILNVSGKMEAWDNNLFFIVGLPLMMLTTFIAGYIEPRHSWVYGLAIVVLQFIALLVSSGFGLFLFVGIVFFVFFAGAGAISAYIGALLKLQLNKKRVHKSKTS